MAEENKQDERVYVISLSAAKWVPNTIRAPAAIKAVKKYIIKHAGTSDVKIDGGVNDFIWKSGITNPPKSVKVKVVLNEGVAVASLAG